MQNEEGLQLQSIANAITNDIKCNSLTIREDSVGLRGLYSTQTHHIGDTILQIQYKIILTHQHFSSALLCKYIKWLRKQSKHANNPILNWNILYIYPAKQYLKQLTSQESQYNMAPLIYFYEQKFCDNESLNLKEKSAEIEDKWMKNYIEYLPHDYGFMPYHYSHIIKNYHTEFGEQLSSFGQKFRFSFDFLKFLLEGKDLPQQYRFLSYLKRETQDNEYYYQKYFQNFTFDSFEWAFFTWKTRVFDKGCMKCKSASGLFIPFLDLINHDKIASNTDWIFDDNHDVMKLVARKDIQNGQQILIDYGQRSLQMFFRDYGFIAKEQACEVKIAINKDTNFSFFINSQIISEQTSIGIKEQIHKFMQKCSSISENIDKNNKLAEQLKKKCSQKEENIAKLHNQTQNKMLSAQQTHVLKQIEELLSIQKKAAQYILDFLNSKVRLQY